MADMTRTIIPDFPSLSMNTSTLNFHDQNKLEILDKEIRNLLIIASHTFNLDPKIIQDMYLSRWYKRKNRIVIRYDQMIYDETLDSSNTVIGSNLIVNIRNNKIDYLVSSLPYPEDEKILTTPKINIPLKLSSYLSIGTKEKFLYHIYNGFSKPLTKWMKDRVHTNQNPQISGTSLPRSKNETIRIFLNNTTLFNDLLKKLNENKSIQFHVGDRNFLQFTSPFGSTNNLILSFDEKNNPFFQIRDNNSKLSEIITMGPKSRDERDVMVIKETTPFKEPIEEVIYSNTYYGKVQKNLVQIAYQLMKYFDLDSYDNKGSPLVAIVNHPAFDIIGSAKWNSIGNELWIGRPSKIFKNVGTYIDIIGHEIFHGVEMSISHLDATGETGALREHLSDVMGLALKQQITPSDEPILIIGADILTDEGLDIYQSNKNTKLIPTGLRDLLHPELSYSNQALHMKDLRIKYGPGVKCLNEQMDFCGIHEQTSIPNQIFARLTQYLVQVRGIKPIEAFTNSVNLVFDTYAYRFSENAIFADYRSHLINECFYKKTDGFFLNSDCQQIETITESLGL